MRFADLFCGIGGFHAALDRLGHECVFATDIDKHAASVYEMNWGKPGGFDVHCDIREVIDEIPEMDIICAGFPCQPFSKSGAQEGFKDQTRGTLFHDICYLAEKHRPAILFLENVPNLIAHDSGNTMQVIEARIEEMGYKHWWKVISPHNYGTCQIRKRVYIVCIRDDLLQDFEFTFPKERSSELDIRTILDDVVDEKYNLSANEIYWISMWQDFLENVNIETKLPGHPIWADYFREGPPLPGNLNDKSIDELREIEIEWGRQNEVLGSIQLEKCGGDERLISITKISLPKWKQDFIRKNRALYQANSEFIEHWISKWRVFEGAETEHPFIPHSRRKYEWQAGPESRSNWENIMQFRPSGIRVKRGDYFPALVAMAQTPVVGWLERRITPKECARIQDFDVDGKYGEPFVLGDSDQQSYKQLGNAVNVNIIRLIQERIDMYIDGIEDSISIEQ
jgi:DNA (cytosine-5)-methyltransferase 1